MRTYQLAEVPAGMMHDELLQLRAAAEVSRGEWKMLYNPGYGSEPLYYPVLSASQSLLGANPLGRRLPGVFAGLMGLCLVYVLAYRLLGWRIAVIALGASAVVWWSVVMQRIILREVLEMPFYALALYTFWRGYEEATRTARPGWRFFIIAGVRVGRGSICTHDSTRLVRRVCLIRPVFAYLSARIIQAPVAWHSGIRAYRRSACRALVDLCRSTS